MKSNLPAQRLTALPPNYFSLLLSRLDQLEREGEKVIRFDIGSPDLPPPDAAINKLIAASSDPTQHGYQAHQGLSSMREAWAYHYQGYHGVALDPDKQVLPLIGSKEGIFHLSLALIDPGDEILIPDPGYQTYQRGAEFAGGTCRSVSCLSGEDFITNLRKLPKIALRRTKLLWANFPHNPTGATIHPKQAEQIVEFSNQQGLILCHDAAYTQVTYQGYRAPSLLETAGEQDPVVEFNSLSKSHNMAGWRLGVLVGNREILKKLYTVKTHADSGHFQPVMQAGTAALQVTGEWIKTRNYQYQQRRDLAVSILKSSGLGVETPRGAIYLWLPVPAGFTSLEFAENLLDDYLVALTPGIVFGSQGDGYLRLSLATPEEQLREGLDRLRKGYADALHH